MRKLLLILMVYFVATCTCNAAFCFDKCFFQNDVRAVKSLLKSQVRYANRENLPKFISTYDASYVNSDGLTLENYSKMVKEVWDTYKNIKYGIEIKEINIENDSATVKLTETSKADIPDSSKMNGILRSTSESIYNLKKINGHWKVVSDSVVDEVTTMMYGDAMNLDIKLSAPHSVEAGSEYTASLEFESPKDVLAIASITSNKVEYPQKTEKEVFRKMPEDNILERLFTANNEKKNEYIVASIGLTKADISDLSFKISMTGFGYKIIRVNVLSQNSKEENDVKVK